MLAMPQQQLDSQRFYQQQQQQQAPQHPPSPLQAHTPSPPRTRSADLSPTRIVLLEAEIAALKARYGLEAAAAAGLGLEQHADMHKSKREGESSEESDTNCLTPLSQAQISTSTGSNGSFNSNPVSPDLHTMSSRGGAVAARTISGRATHGLAALNTRSNPSIPDPVSSPPSSGNRVGVKSKSSCHQCKSSKLDAQLLFCCNKSKDGLRKRRCRKKYCISCLKRCYPSTLPGEGEPPLQTGPAPSKEGTSTWVCPSCTGACGCASCARKKRLASARGGSAADSEADHRAGDEDDDDDGRDGGADGPQQQRGVHSPHHLPPLAAASPASILSRNLHSLNMHSGQGLNFEALRDRAKQQANSHASHSRAPSHTGSVGGRWEEASAGVSNYSHSSAASTPTGSSVSALDAQSYSTRLARVAQLQQQLNAAQAHSLRGLIEEEAGLHSGVGSSPSAKQQRYADGRRGNGGSPRTHSAHAQHSGLLSHSPFSDPSGMAHSSLSRAHSLGSGSPHHHLSLSVDAEVYPSSASASAGHYPQSSPPSAGGSSRPGSSASSSSGKKRKYAAQPGGVVLDESEQRRPRTASVESIPVPSIVRSTSLGAQGHGGSHSLPAAVRCLSSSASTGASSAGGDDSSPLLRALAAEEEGHPSYEELLQSERRIARIEGELRALQSQQKELLASRERRRMHLLGLGVTAAAGVALGAVVESPLGMDGGGMSPYTVDSFASGSAYSNAFSPTAANANQYRGADDFASATPQGLQSSPHSQYPFHPLHSPDSSRAPTASPDVPLNQLRISLASHGLESQSLVSPEPAALAAGSSSAMVSPQPPGLFDSIPAFGAMQSSSNGFYGGLLSPLATGGSHSPNAVMDFGSMMRRQSLGLGSFGLMDTSMSAVNSPLVAQANQITPGVAWTEQLLG